MKLKRKRDFNRKQDTFLLKGKNDCVDVASYATSANSLCHVELNAAFNNITCLLLPVIEEKYMYRLKRGTFANVHSLSMLCPYLEMVN